MTVLFTALMAFVLYREPIGRRRMIGLFSGFLGVIVLAADKTGGVDVWPAALAGTLAALFYGVAAESDPPLSRRRASQCRGRRPLIERQRVFAPFALLSWPQHPIPLHSWVSALALGVICTGAAFVFYYRLINRIGGPRASTVTYLIPLFGVRVGLDRARRTAHLRMAVAAICILGGVAVSQRS